MDTYAEAPLTGQSRVKNARVWGIDRFRALCPRVPEQEVGRATQQASPSHGPPSELSLEREGPGLGAFACDAAVWPLHSWDSHPATLGAADPARPLPQGPGRRCDGLHVRGLPAGPGGRPAPSPR